MLDSETFSWKLTYTGASINRASEIRSMHSSIQELLLDPAAKFLPVWNGCHLFKDGHADAVVLSGSYYHSEPDRFLDPIFLGLNEDAPWFAITMRENVDPEVFSEFGIFEQLHPRVGALDADQAATLAYARGMLLWQINHQHCGTCGEKTVSMQGGHTRVCSNEGCGQRAFPRTDAATITLVEHPDGEHCLLGRQSRWPTGMYSVVAGFVEPGESLEECVIREVHEETGIEVFDPQYLGSQPWPFPSSLMLGFFAKARTTQFRPSDDELADIRWVSKEELLSYGEMGDSTDRHKLPNRHSIARMLIERWRAGLVYDSSSSEGADSSR